MVDAAPKTLRRRSFTPLGAHSGDLEWIFTVSESGEVYFHIVLLFHSEGRFHRPLSVLYPNSDNRLIKSWPIAFPNCVKRRSLSWISVNSYRSGRGRSSFSYLLLFHSEDRCHRSLSVFYPISVDGLLFSFSLRFSALFQGAFQKGVVNSLLWKTGVGSLTV